MVFSLNETGSFADDIIRVVSGKGSASMVNY